MANNIRGAPGARVLPQLPSPRPNPNARTPQQALQEMSRIMGSATAKYQFARSIAPGTPGSDALTLGPNFTSRWVYAKVEGLGSEIYINAAYFRASVLGGAPVVGISLCEYALENATVVGREIVRGQGIVASDPLRVAFFSDVLLVPSRSYCVGMKVECGPADSFSYLVRTTGGASLTKDATYAEGSAFVWSGEVGAGKVCIGGPGSFSPGAVVLAKVNSPAVVIYFNDW